MSLATKALSAAAGLLLLLGACTASQADDVYSNFGPGQTYSTSDVSVAGSSAGGEYYSLAFTPTETVEFTDALAPLVAIIGQDTVTASLLADNGGLPGLSLVTLNQATPITNGIETFTCSSSCPILQAGTQYWLQLMETDPNTDIGWYLSTTDLVNNNNIALGYTFYPPSSVFWPNEPANAFEIDGNPVSPYGAVPEPGAFLLLVLGLITLTAFAPAWHSRDSSYCQAWREHIHGRAQKSLEGHLSGDRL